MAKFSVAVPKTLAMEGEYTNDPKDFGGPTRYGITEKEARANNYDGDMRELPLETALQIYKTKYWDIQLLDQVTDQDVADELFDTGVNCGPGFAIRSAQRAVNVLNKEGTRWFNITVDGVSGPNTVAAINTATSLGFKNELLKALNILQGMRYIEICEKNESQETFAVGWLRQRVGI